MENLTPLIKFSIHINAPPLQKKWKACKNCTNTYEEVFHTSAVIEEHV